MAAKTLLLQGLTAGASAGDASTPDALNITEKVLGVYPTLSDPTVTSQFFSTIATEIVEGKAKYLVNRKRHINQYNTTDGVHTSATSVGGASTGAATRANHKRSNKDEFEFTLNKSWDAGYEYDKKKDPKVREGQLIDDMGSVLEDLTEQKDYSFWNALKTDITSKSSAAFPKYTSSIDEKTVISPVLQPADISIAAAPTSLDAAKLDAAKVVDAIWNDIEGIAKMGRVNSTHAGYPYARGTRNSIGLRIVVNADLIPVISKDERFLPTGKGQSIVITGQIGTINNTPVVRDDVFDTVSGLSYAIIGTGRYSPVIVAQELADSIIVNDDPYKPTLLQLSSASGGWDTAVTPYINLCKFGKVVAA